MKSLDGGHEVSADYPMIPHHYPVTSFLYCYIGGR